MLDTLQDMDFPKHYRLSALLVVSLHLYDTMIGRHSRVMQLVLEGVCPVAER